MEEIKEKTKLAEEIQEILSKIPNYKPPKLEQLEILNLYLENKGIEHEYKPLYDGAQILITTDKKKLSFIIHYGSYGQENGLIEFYNFKNEPRGYLTANDCKKIIRKELLQND